MEHVRQRGTWDCGVAVAAMLAGTGYKQARAVALRVAPGVNPRGLSAYLLDCLLRRLMPGSRWRHDHHCGSPLADVALDHREPAAVIIGLADGSHWVALDRGQVLDPAEAGPVPIGRYRHRDAAASCYLVAE